jgi:hypothetical protein
LACKKFSKANAPCAATWPRPIAEKLRLLDVLRERELAIRRNAVPSDSNLPRKESAPARGNPE